MSDVPYTFENAIRRVTITEHDEILYDSERGDVGCTYLVPERVMDEEIRPQLNEIERLRDELGAALKNEVHYAKRIEELEKHEGYITLEGCVEMIAEREQRIEELEKHNESLRLLNDGSIILLTAQIDAAWEYANSHNDDMAIGAEDALAELGIVRCEGCVIGGLRKDCICNGHGRVKGADDE